MTRNKIETIVPVTNPDVAVYNGFTKPPGRYIFPKPYFDFLPRYGHKIIYISRSQTDAATGFGYTRRYLYMFGGYSSDCGGYCDDLWRYEIP